MTIKVGDIVKTLGFFNGLEGVVTQVTPGSSKEDHGEIVVKVTKITNTRKHPNLRAGDNDYYVYFNWQNILQVVEK